jgi:hypothetical protein
MLEEGTVIELHLPGREVRHRLDDGMKAGSKGHEHLA